MRKVHGGERIDPGRDVELTVTDDVLHISAHREEKSEQKTKDMYQSEFSYGSFSRSVPLPSGADADQTKASYIDGILEVRIPLREPGSADSKKIPIRRS